MARRWLGLGAAAAAGAGLPRGGGPSLGSRGRADGAALAAELARGQGPVQEVRRRPPPGHQRRGGQWSGRGHGEVMLRSCAGHHEVLPPGGGWGGQEAGPVPAGVAGGQ